MDRASKEPQLGIFCCHLVLECDCEFLDGSGFQTRIVEGKELAKGFAEDEVVGCFRSKAEPGLEGQLDKDGIPEGCERHLGHRAHPASP